MRTGAGTSLCEGTRERKKSEITEQGLLQNQGGEEVQGPRSQRSLQSEEDRLAPAAEAGWG